MQDRYVSIIIPVYNAKEYLADCIESVINQSYNKLEILLIDDGSKDESGLICDNYAKKDKRIKVFHTENKGVSHARNIGLSQATKAYIQFVDSDDRIKENMTETLVNQMEANPVELVVCGYDRITQYMNHRDRFFDKEEIYTNKAYLVNTLKEPKGYYYGVIWNKLFKREVIIQNNILFDTKLNLGEDFIFNIDYLKCIQKVSVVNKRLYIYNYIDVASLSRYKKKILEDHIIELKKRENLFAKYKQAFIEMNLYKKYKKQIYWYWKYYYLYNMYALKYGFKSFSAADKKEWERIVKTHKEVTICSKEISNWEKHITFLRFHCNGWWGKIKKRIKNLIRQWKKEKR
jgi:glycosyltransferase involved in cell wall biosynthesis